MRDGVIFQLRTPHGATNLLCWSQLGSELAKFEYAETVIQRLHCLRWALHLLHILFEDNNQPKDHLRDIVFVINENAKVKVEEIQIERPRLSEGKFAILYHQN